MATRTGPGGRTRFTACLCSGTSNPPTTAAAFEFSQRRPRTSGGRHARNLHNL
eukprot:CAMPEP_0179839446 /NCGR_PEP_ID=MMETSP0982-20121206/1324_1 /TAXON_ID=483367 /ORGANISM="non described non described, Strain CCMP 2436" /LENGTH=52 /DNA_ID=CAMNT_0021723105 /DNA_START=58 /DNA_END=216 /DNA_ORIENTATION=+